MSATSSATESTSKAKATRAATSMAAGGPEIFLQFPAESELALREELYFVCTAALGAEKIDVHSASRESISLKYCVGLRLPIDSSHNVETLLSSEWMSGLKYKLTSASGKRKRGVNRVAVLIHGYQMTYESPLLAAQSVLSEALSTSFNLSSLISASDFSPPDSPISDDTVSAMKAGASGFLSDDSKMQKATDYLSDISLSKGAAADCSSATDSGDYYAVFPFIWPSEGYLIATDEGYDSALSKQLVCHELAVLVERLAAYFQSVDLIAHSSGCDIAITAIEEVLRGKHRDFLNDTRMVLVAPEMVQSELKKSVRRINPFIGGMTVYVNTWDWRLSAVKWTRWSEDRAGHTLAIAADNSSIDVIDVTDLVSDWRTTNHFYLTQKSIMADIKAYLVQNLPPKDRVCVSTKTAEGYFVLSQIDDSLL